MAPVAKESVTPLPPPETFEIPPEDPALTIDTADVSNRAPVWGGTYERIRVGWDQRDRKAAAALATSIADELRKDPNAPIGLQPSDDVYIDYETDLLTETDGKEVDAYVARLHDNEVGIRRADTGYDVFVRFALDPLESRDVFARRFGEGPHWVYAVVVEWSPRKRTKAEAETLARDLAAKMRLKKTDVHKLVHDVSEESEKWRHGDLPIDLRDQGNLRLAILGYRLEMDEVTVLRVLDAYYIVKRVPEPTPDPLETAAVFKRTPVDRAVVKAIGIGWNEAHEDGDTVGAKRTRADVDKLVKLALHRAADGKTTFDDLVDGTDVFRQRMELYPGDNHPARIIDFGLRLKVGEIGVVRSKRGMHIVKRIE